MEHIYRRGYPAIGRKLHPGRLAKGDGVQVGVSPFMRCRQCGFVNDTRNTAWSIQGEGNTSDPVTGENKVGSGCALCGSLYWQKTKPPHLPDDRNIPDGHIKVMGVKKT